jgi:hypothetical protein
LLFNFARRTDNLVNSFELKTLKVGGSDVDECSWPDVICQRDEYQEKRAKRADNALVG